MANFFMRKLIMTVMLALVMIRLNEVQANDSPPTRVSHPFKAENMHKTFSSCLESKFEDCKTVTRVRKNEKHMSDHIVLLIVLKVASK
jgi:glutamate mutase epsilon subunit